MLIKHRLYLSNAVMVVLAVIVMLLAAASFSSLSTHLQAVSQAADNSLSAAGDVASSAAAASTRTARINQDILLIVDGIEQTNQKAKLTSRKVQEISSSLSELSETIQLILEDVTDEATLDILQEIDDEICDIEERTRREAVINLVESSKNIAMFSQQIKEQAGRVSQLNSETAKQLSLAEQASEFSHQITDEVAVSLDEIIIEETLIISALVVLVVLMVLSAGLMIKVVIYPISHTVELMEDIAQGEGDLTQRLSVKGDDEMALIGHAFNRFVEKVQLLLADVHQSTQALQQTTANTLDEMNTSYEVVKRQQYEIEQIATAINQMNATSHSVAHSAVEAASATSDVNSKVTTSQNTVSEAQQSVSSLVDQVQQSVQVIDTLDGKSQDINKIVDVISAVAEQTSLLALNAAIEAARAGEQGRGFAVVADEVRSLASKAEASSQDIRKIVDDIQQMTTQAVDVMRSSQEACGSTVAGAQETAHALEDILGSVATIDDMNTQIASASEEGSAVTEEINQRITEVNQLSLKTSEGVEKTVQACDSLNQISDQVYKQLSQFKI